MVQPRAEYFLQALDDTGQVVRELPLAGKVTIGQGSPAFAPDVVISGECQSASREHAAIDVGGNHPALTDKSRFGTIVNGRRFEHASVQLCHGDEVTFGLEGSGWRVRFRVAGYEVTRRADPLEMLAVSETPRKVYIGRTAIEEHLGGRAFYLLKFLRHHPWFNPEWLIGAESSGALCFKILTGQFPRELTDRFPGSSDVLRVIPLTPQEPIKITIASSSDKKLWLNQAVATFNDDSRSNRHLQFQGRPIQVLVLLEEIDPGVWDHYRSGTMVTDTLDRKIEPTMISPAEQSWILNLKEDWPGRKSITSDDATGLLRTPLVIAMWRSRAVALGFWPVTGPNAIWGRLRSLASSADGWGSLGHPEWGKLKYGYAFVGKSNSATFTQILNGMSGLQKRGPLTLDDVRADNGFGKAMADLEKADIRIAQKSEWLLRWMRERGPEYLDAVTAYEQQVIGVNKEWGPTLPEPIVAVYPQDGTILVTHPLSILDGAPWVTEDQAKASQIFLEFLLSKQQQSLLARYGFRPLDSAASLGPGFDPTYGANPQANLVLAEVPNSHVINSVIRLWEATRARK